MLSLRGGFSLPGLMYPLTTTPALLFLQNSREYFQTASEHMYLRHPIGTLSSTCSKLYLYLLFYFQTSFPLCIIYLPIKNPVVQARNPTPFFTFILPQPCLLLPSPPIPLPTFSWSLMHWLHFQIISWFDRFLSIPITGSHHIHTISYYTFVAGF